MTGWMGRLRGLLRRADGLDWLIVGAAALGMALVLARVLPYNAAVNSDSQNYIEMARNVLAGEGFTNYEGSSIALWPPGYPLLLAVAGFGIIDPYDVAGPLNAAMFGLAILAVGRYLRRRLEVGLLALWACVALALALPLAEVARWAWSETSFILFATLALIQTDRALRDGSWATLAWAAIFCALAWQMRYIGAVVSALTGLALLLAGGMPLSLRLRRAAFFAAIAGAPMALWFLRNYIATGRLRAIDSASPPSLSDILWGSAQIVASWLQPLSGWFAVIVIGALILSLFIPMARGGKPCARRACLIFGGFALAYAALTSVVLMLGYTWRVVQPRYVAVLYIPMIVVATFALDGLFGWARARRAAAGAGRRPHMRTFAWKGVFRLDRLLAIALGCGMCAWIAAQAIDNADHIARANSGKLALGRAGPFWTESDIMRYLHENLSGAVIYTNSPVNANFHSGGNADYRGLKDVVPSRDEFMRWATMNEGAYVVWINDHNALEEFRPINMRVREGLEPVAKFADGEVFRVNSEYKPNPDASPYYNAYSAVARGEAARLSSGAGFDVYVHQNTLIYFKRPCAIADAQSRFFLHIFPENAADLPTDARGNRFENLDFEFDQRGALFEDNCVALMPLPRYEYERIRTGQHVSGEGALWRVEFDVDGGE